MKIILLATLLFALLMPPLPTIADRAYQTIGRNIQEADTIVIADTKKSGDDTLVTFREIILGDQRLVGRSLRVTLRQMSTEGPYLPSDTTEIAILLGKSWQTGHGLPILEVYQSPLDIAALRVLVQIYQLPAEGARLRALIVHVKDPNPRFREQIFDDLGRMHDPTSYPLLPALFPMLDGEGQRKLVDLIGEIGDRRGVPTLIQAMRSPDRSVRLAAEQTSYWNFPGAPGMTEAFRQALSDPEMALYAAQYLAKREPSPQTRAILAANQTPLSQSTELREAGDLKSSNALLLGIAEDAARPDDERRFAAEELAPTILTAHKDDLRRALLPLLSHDAASGNYLNARSAAKLLRSFHHPECLPPLLSMLDRRDITDRLTCQTTAMAFLESGPQARQAAIARVLQNIKLPPATGVSAALNDPTLPFLELAWLGDTVGYAKVGETLDAQSHLYWENIQPLVGVSQQKDEGLFLTELLKRQLSKATLPPEAMDWVIFCLGDLRERRAIAPLFDYLVKFPWAGDYSATDALVQIGGPNVTWEATRRLTSPDRDWVRPQVVDILCRTQGEKARPTLRRMIREDDYGSPATALTWLAQWGGPEDLTLIEPLCDFWMADRGLHYSAMTAAASIRDRLNYDVNGPITRH